MEQQTLRDAAAALHALPQTRIQLLEDLVRAGVFEFRKQGEEGFRLAHHASNPQLELSPWRVNLRMPDHKGRQTGVMTEELWGRVADECATFLTDDWVLAFYQLAGVPHAGTIMARELAKACGRRGCYTPYVLTLQRETTDTGERQITGVDGKGSNEFSLVVLVDDVLTRSVVKCACIACLRSRGYEVHHIIVVVDRGEGGRVELVKEKMGCLVKALFTAEHVLSCALLQGVIDEATCSHVRAYIARRADPKNGV